MKTFQKEKKNFHIKIIIYKHIQKKKGTQITKRKIQSQY